MRFIALLSDVLIGIAFAMQPPVNAEVARKLGSPFAAALLSLSLSAVILLVVALLTGVRVQPASFAALPWWFMLAGMIGAVVVTGSTLIVPVIGAAALVACIVFGQAIGASIVDQFGLFRLAVKPLDGWKAAGLLIMFVGLLVFQKGRF